jgi:anti-sigma factor RsiW
MSCSYADWDGAYVLGALSPGDRLEFERHVQGCTSCAAAVRDIAGLPGLLGRVDESALAGNGPDADLPPVPEMLLPRLRREIRSRTRRRLVGTGLLAASAAAAVVLALPVIDGPQGPPATNTSSVPYAGRPMTALSGGPMQARLALEPVAWGTRLDLVCTYQPTAYTGGEHIGAYSLLLHTRNGGVERVGTWRPVAGQAMRLTAATAVSRQDIASVEVQTAQGRPVLRLDR